MRVSVTGASGFVGRAFCAEAAAKGFVVQTGMLTACDLSGIGTSMGISQIDEATDWRSALLGALHVVHLAAHAQHRGRPANGLSLRQCGRYYKLGQKNSDVGLPRNWPEQSRIAYVNHANCMASFLHGILDSILAQKIIEDETGSAQIVRNS
jgi:hypothetical protein